MTTLMTLASALALGSLHALEPDHMAAVTNFAVRRPRPRAALLFGVRWAIGHGGAILAVGAVLLVFGATVPESATAGLERLVGVVMIGLGIWTLRAARTLHVHTHAHADGTVHAHLHAHAAPADRQDGHDHRHAVTAIGLLHGLAGSGSAIALIPLVGFRSPGAALLYLACFALGTIGAMALYTMLAGVVLGRAASASAPLARAIAHATGAVTIAIGAIWLLR